MSEIEKSIKLFIENFVQKEKVSRSLFELTNLKKRSKFVNRLNHDWESVLQMKYFTQIEKSDDNLVEIQRLLGFKNDDVCYVVSNFDAFDNKLLPFQEVFREIYFKGLGTILLNENGDTLFLETEQEYGAAKRFIGRRINK